MKGIAQSNAAMATERTSPRPAPAPPCLAQVYGDEFDYVYRCLRSLGVAESSTDDALQDVFVVVQEKLPSFEPRANIRTWLYAIVLRVARRYRERVARERARHVSDAELESVTREPEHNERLRLAQLALAALSSDRREVFVLSQVERFSAPEIAQMTGLPLNTVYSRLRAARAEFAAELERLTRPSPSIRRRSR